jgi:hypothetical protein
MPCSAENFAGSLRSCSKSRPKMVTREPSRFGASVVTMAPSTSTATVTRAPLNMFRTIASASGGRSGRAPVDGVGGVAEGAVSAPSTDGAPCGSRMRRVDGPSATGVSRSNRSCGVGVAPP